MVMKITFNCRDTKMQPWLEGIRGALPEAIVTEWHTGDEEADYAIVWRPTQQFLDEQQRLKGIFNIGAGVDAIMPMKLPPHAKVVRLEDAGMSVQMAEYVCHAVIRYFRDFASFQDAAVSKRWGFKKPKRREEFPIGVMGLGVLGQRVAQALRGFDFKVNGWSQSKKEIDGIQTYSGQDQFHAFLTASKVLVCLLPLTDQTANVMNLANLQRLQDGAYIINVARGQHLVEEDLIQLIDAGHIAGATLDVFREEPLPAAHAFWSHPKITVTPHTSARTLRDESIAQIAQKIAALSRGEVINGVVNLQRGY
jgi:glyoxylate/hydroxypyruvate reductase